MRVRPSRAGLLVGYPGRTTSLAQGGEEVPRSAYWMRRLMKGDVVLVVQKDLTPGSSTAGLEAGSGEPRSSRKKRGARRTAGAADPDPEI